MTYNHTTYNIQHYKVEENFKEKQTKKKNCSTSFKLFKYYYYSYIYTVTITSRTDSNKIEYCCATILYLSFVTTHNIQQYIHNTHIYFIAIKVHFLFLILSPEIYVYSFSITQNV